MRHSSLPTHRLRLPRLRIWHWFVVVAVVALDLASMQTWGLFFYFHVALQHGVALAPAIAIPIIARKRFTNPGAGILLIALAAIFTPVPLTTGYGEYHPGGSWISLVTTPNGFMAILLPLAVSVFFTSIVVAMSAKTLHHREELRQRNIATRKLLELQASRENNSESVDHSLASILPDPDQS